ncbi:hypothetical protein FSP39_021042 [Pinctada imbricata]|uniref:Uncharacterized protein n=1 Tax=Pinctada imbricata TaxID=66713 RepID=A0AA88XJU5_PINIB|nr:hypothetical protein FSP39_021042 [Pinctada imbricata]
MAQTQLSGSLDKITEPLSLEEILVSFNNPINEEQAWAVCHQCAQYFVTKNSQCKFRELYVHGRRSVRVKKDGDIYIEYAEISRGSGKGPPIRRRNSVTGKDIKVVTETDAIQALGLIIYHALDYGLGEHEERHLSRDLERLLEVLINPDEEDEESQYAQDEGIEKDAKEGNTFQDVVTLCAQHLSNAEDAGHHYKAVCRALVAEAGELVTFLDKISNGQENLAKVALDDDGNLEDLRRSDWARLWVQIMRELRRGVRLKKVEDSCITRTEYELTPFEIILEDIRSRRYSLNKVMVNGDIPPNIKKDAHAVILDFIRSRPPLHPVKERILKSPPQRELEPREKLMVEIRSQPKLKPVQAGRRLVETSRTKLNNEDELESPQPAKKLIKPDFSLLLDSFDETDTDDCSSLTSSRRSSVASPSPERDRGTWRRAVVRDAVTTTTDRHGILTRRNTITVCESPNKVSPPSPNGSTHDLTDPSAKLQHNKVHDARPSRLRRSGNVAMTHAHASDVRQRLIQKLHGIEESLEPSIEKRMHRAACKSINTSREKSAERDVSNPISSVVKKRMQISKSKSISYSVERLSEEEESPESEYVFDRSQGHRMPIPRKLFQQRISKSQSSDQIKIQPQESDVKTDVKTRPQPLQRSGSSGSLSKEKPKPMVRARSACEIKPPVQVRTSIGQRARSVLEMKSEDKIKSDSTSASERASPTPEPRARPKPAPRTSVGRLSPVTVQTASTSPGAGKTEQVKNSADSEKSSRTRWRKDVGSEKSSSEPRDGSPKSSDRPSKILSRQSSSQRKQILISARKSSQNSSSPPSSPSDKQREKSGQVDSMGKRLSVHKGAESEDVQRRLQQIPDQPIEILSLDSVQRRVRPQIVQRSKSHKFTRHSMDLSSIRAIPESDSDSGSPIKSRSIMLGRQRKEAEELKIKVNKAEAPTESVDVAKEEKSESESTDHESTTTKLSELNVTELLHVSEASTEQVTNCVSPSPSISSDSDSAKKWNHPIECLSLTLEEVTHIRMVLTKAELEQLISNQEVYNLVSKGKMCFTCKLVKFSMFGQWGTRCKICKRNVCNNCLRKMNIPTEHFQNIPVHTLSPIPLGQDALDILKVYESTGSVPHTPNSEKKDFIQTANLESKSTKNRSLQRSHTIGSGTQPPMLPNKNLLKGPLMNVCCDCKSMIMEIIRTSRTSIALINQRKEGGAPAQAPPTSPGKDRLSTSSLSLNIKSFFSK